MSSPWKNEKLGKIATQITKGTTPTTAGFQYLHEGIPFVKVENINGFGIDLSSINQYISEEAHDALKRSQFEVGDVLFSIAGTIGKTALVEPKHIPANTNQAVAIIRGISEIFSAKFLKYQLQAASKEIQNEKARGGGMNNVSLTDIKSIEVSVPPLAEQKVIAEKLDKLLAKVDSIKARLDAVPNTLKRFRQSVLAAAVSGKLTEEWRKGSGVSKPVETVLDDVSNLITKGASPKWQGISYVEDDTQTLFVTSENVGSYELLLDKPKYLEDAFNDKQKRSILQFGDVLTNIVGASIGRAAVWNLERKANINQAVCLIRLDSEKCLPDFLSYFLNSPVGIDKLLGNKVDVARANVSLGNIKELDFLLPNLEEQAEIVRHVEKLFAYADKVEAEVNAAQERVNKLTQSILAKAFRGELTAKWREQNPELISDENSAEALLEKIKAEREKLKPTKKRKAK
ncbi:MAG: restriction endonuclease subunit S [Pseudomonadota bacterium]|nr:restriction endonuclease subunit S [Pseudomonadota bacterium]